MLRKIERPLVMSILATVLFFLQKSNFYSSALLSIAFFFAGMFSENFWAFLKLSLVKFGAFLAQIIGSSMAFVLYFIAFGLAKFFRVYGRNANSLEEKRYSSVDLSEPF